MTARVSEPEHLCYGGKDPPRCTFGDAETQRAYRLHRFALRGPQPRVRLSVVCMLSLVSLMAKRASCAQGVQTHVLSNYRVANALLDATPLVLWLALTAASGRRALVTAENYERIMFRCAMLCLGFRYLSAFFGSRDLQVQDTPALSEPWVPPELLPSFLLVDGLMRVVLHFVSAIFLLGLQPTAALVVSLTDAAGTLMRLFRSQIFVALPPIGPAPAWVVYLLLLGVNIGVIFCCALYYAGLEQRAFSLHQELQTAKNDRIEQLAGEKERLQYGVGMIRYARDTHTHTATPCPVHVPSPYHQPCRRAASLAAGLARGRLRLCSTGSLPQHPASQRLGP